MTGDDRIDRGEWRELATRAASLFRRLLPASVAYVLIYRLVAAFVLVPMVALLLVGLISRSGYATLSNYDLFGFLLSPLGVAAIVVVGIQFFCLAYLEQAGLIILASAAISGTRASVSAAIVETAASGWRLFLLSLIVLGRIAWRVGPLAAIGGLTYWLLLTKYDINYYLANRPPEFLLAIGIAIVLSCVAVCIILQVFTRAVFAVHEVVLCGCDPVGAARRSHQLAQPDKWHIAGLLATWVAAILLGGALLSGLAGVLVRVPLAAATRNEAFLVPAIALGLLIHASVSLLLSLVLTPALVAMTTTLYFRLKGIKAVYPRPVETPKVLRRLIPLAVGAGLLYAGVAGYTAVQQASMGDAAKVVAHKGASGAAPENTLAAMREAIGQKADYAELDVQCTKDGVVVLCHDKDTMRVAGKPFVVTETNFAELKDLDVGGGFSAKFRGEKLPTFEEVLAAVRGRMGLVVELKYYGPDERLVPKVLDLITSAGMRNSVIIMSSSYEALQQVRRLDPGLETGYIVFAAESRLTDLDVNALSVKASEATGELLRQATRAGKDVYAWTVNDPAEMDRLVSRGVDGIVTDQPAKMRALLDERSLLSESDKVRRWLTDWISRN